MSLLSWASKIINVFANKVDASTSAMADYLTDCSQYEPNYQGKMPFDYELHYFLNNSLQSLWVAMYGNTTDTTGQTTEITKMARDIAYKPVHLLARTQQALAEYVQPRPELDITQPRAFDPEQAAQDGTFCNLTQAAEHAQKLMDVFATRFAADLDLYHSIFEEAWSYKPWNQNAEKLARSQTPAQKAVAARFAAMKNRNTDAGPDEATNVYRANS